MDNVKDKLSLDLRIKVWDKSRINGLNRYPIWNRVCPSNIYNITRLAIMRKLMLTLKSFVV